MMTNIASNFIRPWLLCYDMRTPRGPMSTLRAKPQTEEQRASATARPAERAAHPRLSRNWTDEELVEECMRGNEEAWRAVVDKYKNLVYSAPMKYRMGPQDAADIFQEVWVDLYAELGRLRKPGALRSWLVSVASHKCYQWKRRRSRESEPQGNAADREPVSKELLFPEWKEQTERLEVLREAIASLPERCQRMVHLLFYHEPPLTYAEVAQALGLAQGSIGFIRGRCLQKLRQGLDQKGF